MSSLAHKESCSDCGEDATFEYSAVPTDDPGRDRDGPVNVVCTNAECDDYVQPGRPNENVPRPEG
jgi:hypothetical protein